MTGSDDADGAWAGNDIPVPEPPSDIVAVPSRSQTGPPTVDPSDPVGAPRLGPIATTQPNPEQPSATSGRTRNVVVGALLAGFALVAAVLLVGGNDDPAATDDSTTTAAPPDTVERTSTTSVSSTPSTAPSVRPQRLDLPPEVAAITEPTEVLMLASDGMLHTLSLPSGAVRSVPVVTDGSEVYPGQSLVVAPDAAALSTGRGIMIVLRDAPTTIEIDAERFDGEGVDVAGWHPAPDGTTRFLVFSYGSQGQNASYEVGLDGEVTVIGEGRSDISREYSTSRTDDGRAYVSDAGGVYEIAVDGSAARVDDGVLRGASSNALLIRQCTPDLVCGDVLVDPTTGERRPIGDGVVPDDMQFSGFGLDLAPDGSAISAIVDSMNSQELAVVDLVSGDRLTTDVQGWGRGSRWAADSSGVFESSATGSGVEFLSRVAGAQVHFADELEQVVALGVRRPASELASEPEVTTVPITFTADPEQPSATGLDVVVLTRSGNVAEVDIDARTANIWSAPEAIAVPYPAVFRLAGQVAVLTNDGPDGATSGYLALPGDQQALPPGLFGDGSILAGPAPGTVWTSATTVADSAPVGVQQVLVDLATGRPAEPPQSIGVPGGVLLGGDGRGNLVVERGGDVYIAAAAGDVTDLRRLTSGELLAIGVDTAYVRECDDASVCSVVRVDRVGGTRIAVAESLGLLPASAIDATDPPFGHVGTGVAPGGDVFVVSTVDGWLLVDGANGLSTFLENLDQDAPFVWSADGRSAVTLGGADLVVVGFDGVSAVQGLGSLRALAGAPVVITD